MAKDIFFPADILLPDGVSPEIWSVIACDQFSSEPDYWDRVSQTAGDAPSTINMIIPEAFLGEIDEDESIAGISEAMDGYLKRGVLREIRDSFVYVERTLSDGRVRKGLVGAIDLEEYEFSGGEAAILASEGTVLERLPARIRVRRAARLELPHIITFINDSDATVIEPLSAKRDELPLLYDSDLMEGGGHIRGMRVSGCDAESVMEALRTLSEKDRILMVIGDGNHSLAAAKVFWDELKQGLRESGHCGFGNSESGLLESGRREFAPDNHPARRALVEVNNVYDPAISFEAIHRVIWCVDPRELVGELVNALPSGDSFKLQWVAGKENGEIGVYAECIGDMLAGLQKFLDGYVSRTDCRIDYIHGEDAVKQLARDERCLGIILPGMDKSGLFGTVAAGRVFPKKSFSVGHARDKRYYLECRSIKADD